MAVAFVNQLTLNAYMVAASVDPSNSPSEESSLFLFLSPLSLLSSSSSSPSSHKDKFKSALITRENLSLLIPTDEEASLLISTDH